MRLLHAALFALAARGDPALARAVLSLVASLIPGAGLIILASAAFEGPTRDLLWVLAVVLDYGIVLGRGAEGWHVHAAHFAERFGLVADHRARRVDRRHRRRRRGRRARRRRGGSPRCSRVGIACALWWAYFDVVAVVAEQRFTSRRRAATQLRMARDSYALLHLPMIAGIVLFALGVKKVLEHTGDPLKDMPAVALCGGLALYLLAHVGVPAAQRRLGQLAADRRRRGLPRADPGRDEVAGVAHARRAARRLGGADRLRGRALRARRAPGSAPSAIGH